MYWQSLHWGAFSSVWSFCDFSPSAEDEMKIPNSYSIIQNDQADVQNDYTFYVDAWTLKKEKERKERKKKKREEKEKRKRKKKN